MGLTQPRRDAEFIAWAQNLCDQCVENQIAWRLDADAVATCQTLTMNAQTAYADNANPETTNRLTTANKNAGFKALRSFLSTFIMALVSNLHVPNAALVAMGLPSREHHAHEPLPRPTFAPSIYTVAGQHFTVTVYVEIPQHGHPSSYLTQHGLHGFVLRYRKEGESEWREVHSTRLHVTLTFEEADQAKFLTLAAAWINPRLEHGPWSDEIKVLIN
jgi:hypothetical protein